MKTRFKLSEFKTRLDVIGAPAVFNEFDVNGEIEVDEAEGIPVSGWSLLMFALHRTSKIYSLDLVEKILMRDDLSSQTVNRRSRYGDEAKEETVALEVALANNQPLRIILLLFIKGADFNSPLIDKHLDKASLADDVKNFIRLITKFNAEKESSIENALQYQKEILEIVSRIGDEEVIRQVRTKLEIDPLAKFNQAEKELSFEKAVQYAKEILQKNKDEKITKQIEARLLKMVVAIIKLEGLSFVQQRMFLDFYDKRFQAVSAFISLLSSFYVAQADSMLDRLFEVGPKLIAQYRELGEEGEAKKVAAVLEEYGEAKKVASVLEEYQDIQSSNILKLDSAWQALALKSKANDKFYQSMCDSFFQRVKSYRELKLHEKLLIVSRLQYIFGEKAKPFFKSLQGTIADNTLELWLKPEHELEIKEEIEALKARPARLMHPFFIFKVFAALANPAIPNREALLQDLIQLKHRMPIEALMVGQDETLYEAARKELDKAREQGLNVSELQVLFKKRKTFNPESPRFQSESVEEWKHILDEYDVNARGPNGETFLIEALRFSRQSGDVAEFILAHPDLLPETCNVVIQADHGNEALYRAMVGNEAVYRAMVANEASYRAMVENLFFKATLLLLKKGISKVDTIKDVIVKDSHGHKINITNDCIEIVKTYAALKRKEGGEDAVVELSLKLADAYQRIGDEAEKEKWLQHTPVGKALAWLNDPQRRMQVILELQKIMSTRAQSSMQPIAEARFKAIADNEVKDERSPSQEEQYEANFTLAYFAAKKLNVGEMLARLKKAYALKGEDHSRDAFFKLFLSDLFNMTNMKELDALLSSVDFNMRLNEDFLQACIEGSLNGKKARLYNQAVMQIHRVWEPKFAWYEANQDLYKALQLALGKVKNALLEPLDELEEMEKNPNRSFSHPAYFILNVLKAIGTVEESTAKKLLTYLKNESIQQRIDVRILSKNDKESKTLLKAAMELCEAAVKRFPKESGLEMLQKKLQHEAGVKAAPEGKEEKANPQLLIIQEFGAKLTEAFGKNDPKQALHFLRQFLALRDKTNVDIVDPLLLSAFNEIERLKQGAADINELIALRKQLALVMVKEAEASIAKQLLPYIESSQEVKAVCEARSKLSENDPVVRELEPRVRLFKCIEDKPSLQKIAEGAKQGDLILLHYLAHHHVYKANWGLFGASENPKLFLCSKIALLTAQKEVASQHTGLPLSLINEMHEKAVARINQSKKKDGDFATWCARFVEAFKQSPDDLYGDKILPERVLLNAISMPAHPDLISAMKEALLYTPGDIELLKKQEVQQQAAAAAVPAAAAAAAPQAAPVAAPAPEERELDDMSGRAVPPPSEADEERPRERGPSQ